MRVVTALDDLHFANGEKRVEADKTHVLVYDGQAVEIDLTAEHATELEQLLAIYFKAGRRPDTGSPHYGRGRHSPALSPSGKRGMTGRSRAETKAARDWGAANGLAHLFTTPSGSMYYRVEFVEKWDAHKLAEGLTYE